MRQWPPAGVLRVGPEPVWWWLPKRAGAPSPLVAEGAALFQKAGAGGAPAPDIATPLRSWTRRCATTTPPSTGSGGRHSFVHGAVRWGDRGWYLGWRGQLRADLRRDHERVRERSFHAGHQIETRRPACKPKRLRPFVVEENSRRYFYDMNQCSWTISLLLRLDGRLERSAVWPPSAAWV